MIVARAHCHPLWSMAMKVNSMLIAHNLQNFKVAILGGSFDIKTEAEILNGFTALDVEVVPLQTTPIIPLNTGLPIRRRKNIMNRGDFYKIIPKVPRINKCDHRRTYGHALFNTLNSGDWSMLWKYMVAYSAANFQSVYSYRVADSRVMTVPPTLVINNVEGLLEYAFLRYMMLPDFVYTIRDVQITVKSDGTSVVKVDFTSQFTSIYDSRNSQQVLLDDLSNLPLTTNESSSMFERASERAIVKMKMIQEDFLQQHGSIHFPLMSPSQTTGVVSMFIDTESKIYRLEYSMNIESMSR